MTTKTSIKPKVDNTPATLKTLFEIEAEVGLPFTAIDSEYGVRGFIGIARTLDACPHCGEHVSLGSGYFSTKSSCESKGEQAACGFLGNYKRWALLY
jgi:hypothetical protein